MSSFVHTVRRRIPFSARGVFAWGGWSFQLRRATAVWGFEATTTLSMSTSTTTTSTSQSLASRLISPALITRSTARQRELQARSAMVRLYTNSTEGPLRESLFDLHWSSADGVIAKGALGSPPRVTALYLKRFLPYRYTNLSIRPTRAWWPYPYACPCRLESRLFSLWRSSPKPGRILETASKTSSFE